jgi:hypothetical protein
LNFKKLKLFYEYSASNIFFYSLHCFLNFWYEIIIYSIYPHELFFNFLMWNNYTILYIFFIAYIHINYFLAFWYGITTLHFMSHTLCKSFHVGY